jgi:hypothetical protein
MPMWSGLVTTMLRRSALYPCHDDRENLQSMGLIMLGPSTEPLLSGVEGLRMTSGYWNSNSARFFSIFRFTRCSALSMDFT